MNNKNIDNLLKNLLNEEIEKKSGLMVEKLHGKQSKLDVAKPKGKLDAADFKKLRSMKKKQTNEESEMCEQCGGNMTEGVCEQCQMEEGNLFTDKLRKTKKGDKFKIGNKTYTDNSDLDEMTVKESNTITFTESEIVDLIENLVIETKNNIQKKKAAASTKLEKSNKTSGEDEKDYMKQLVDKMKNYLKDGSKGKYEMNPKHFPKGNGELGEMEKKTYKASKAVDEYIENFTAAGMENLVFDEIHPDEKWMDDNIEGSSRTGNNPEYANAVETDVNKKRNQIRKQNLLGAAKQLAYNKAPQPTEEVTGPQAKFQKNFGKDAAGKVNKILNQLESVDNKKSEKINEQVERMFKIISYKQKTQ